MHLFIGRSLPFVIAPSLFLALPGGLQADCYRDYRDSYECEYQCREGFWDRLARWEAVGSTVFQLFNQARTQWEPAWESGPVRLGAPGFAQGVPAPASRAYEGPPLSPPPGAYPPEIARGEYVPGFDSAPVGLSPWRREQERLVAGLEVQLIGVNRRLAEAGARLEASLRSGSPNIRLAQQEYAALLREAEQTRAELIRVRNGGPGEFGGGVSVPRFETEAGFAGPDYGVVRGESDRDIEEARHRVASLREELAGREADLERLQGTTQPAEAGREREELGPSSNWEDEVPFATPVPGRPGIVYSPFTGDELKTIDVTGLEPGSMAKDPRTGQVFRVP